MCIISHVNEDCLIIIVNFLKIEETLLLTLCDHRHRDFLINQENVWKRFISIPRPLWIPNYYSFALKLLNKSSLTCMRCDRHLSRFCVLIICNCTVNFQNSNSFPRWHWNCVNERQLRRSVGNCPCPICEKINMYVLVTSYP